MISWLSAVSIVLLESKYEAELIDKLIRLGILKSFASIKPHCAYDSHSELLMLRLYKTETNKVSYLNSLTKIRKQTSSSFE